MHRSTGADSQHWSSATMSRLDGRPVFATAAQHMALPYPASQAKMSWKVQPRATRALRRKLRGSDPAFRMNSQQRAEPSQ